MASAGPNDQYCVRAVAHHPIPLIVGAFPLLGLQSADPGAYDFVTAKNAKPTWVVGGTISVGDVICYAKSSDGGSSWWDVAEGLVTGAITGLGQLVN